MRNLFRVTIENPGQPDHTNTSFFTIAGDRVTIKLVKWNEMTPTQKKRVIDADWDAHERKLRERESEYPN